MFGKSKPMGMPACRWNSQEDKESRKGSAQAERSRWKRVRHQEMASRGPRERGDGNDHGIRGTWFIGRMGYLPTSSRVPAIVERPDRGVSKSRAALSTWLRHSGPWEWW